MNNIPSEAKTPDEAKINNQCGNPLSLRRFSISHGEIATPIFFEKKKLFRNDGAAWESLL
jgi:hypothetical protein